MSEELAGLEKIHAQIHATEDWYNQVFDRRDKDEIVRFALSGKGGIAGYLKSFRENPNFQRKTDDQLLNYASNLATSLKIETRIQQLRTQNPSYIK